MSRPRITRLEGGGEVILKNIPKEQADAIQAMVISRSGPMLSKTVSSGIPEQKVAAPSSEVDSLGNLEVNTTVDFPTKALTIVHNPVTLKYELISVGVDVNTRTSGDVKVLFSSGNKHEVIDQFKVVAVDLRIVV